MLEKLLALRDYDLSPAETLAIQSLLALQELLERSTPEELDHLRDATVSELVHMIKRS